MASITPGPNHFDRTINTSKVPECDLPAEEALQSVQDESSDKSGKKDASGEALGGRDWVRGRVLLPCMCRDWSSGVNARVRTRSPVVGSGAPITVLPPGCWLTWPVPDGLPPH